MRRPQGPGTPLTSRRYSKLWLATQLVVWLPILLALVVIIVTRD